MSLSSDVCVLRFDAPEYPERLRHLEQPPRVLYARGRLELLNRTALAVVGSRACTEYGREMTEAIVGPVAAAGVVIVSGLALGIDGCAHAAALDAGGGTIAVLGNGIDIVYPKTNRRLFERIAEEGLILTEFAPGTKPLPFHFPFRNRIIAMLAQLVLVIEATAKGGSLSTAAHARNHSDVLAVPGPVGRPTSEGTNYLIRDGAHLVTSAADVLFHFGMTFPATTEAERDETSPVLNLNDHQRRVMAALTGEGAHLEAIARKSKLPASEVALTLLHLELAGFARQLTGNRYALPRAATKARSRIASSG